MKELVYVDDPVEAFFLQIQGSGRVRLAEGGVMRVGYADQNGYPFRSIGRLLVERGELTLDKASMQGIKDWGRRNPDKLLPLLDENPSYVFFREVPAPAPGTPEAEIDGPIGTLGVPLLRERTLAVDPRSIPLGAPVFLATTYPLSTRPLQRLMLAQDTGGAIRGAVRARLLLGLRRRRRTAGGPDEAGRADVDPVAEGCGTARTARAAQSLSTRREPRRLAGEHFFGLLVRVVRRAHQRADGRMPEAHRVGLALERRERVRMHVAQHRQMARRRLQILAERQHVDVVRAHVAHHREDLVVGLAQAHHQAGLGRQSPGSAA